MSTIAPMRHRLENEAARRLTREKTMRRQAIIEIENLLRTKLTPTHERTLRRELAEHQQALEGLR